MAVPGSAIPTTRFRGSSHAHLDRSRRRAPAAALVRHLCPRGRDLRPDYLLLHGPSLRNSPARCRPGDRGGCLPRRLLGAPEGRLRKLLGRNMSIGQGAVLNASGRRDNPAAAVRRFTLAALGLAGAAATLAGWTPLRFAALTVALFAGPHNWMEARYFLYRLPARWGKLRGYFLLSLTGIFGLTASRAALPGLAGRWHGDPGAGFLLSALWNSLL